VGIVPYGLHHSHVMTCTIGDDDMGHMKAQIEELKAVFDQALKWHLFCRGHKVTMVQEAWLYEMTLQMLRGETDLAECLNIATMSVTFNEDTDRFEHHHGATDDIDPVLQYTTRSLPAFYKHRKKRFKVGDHVVKKEPLVKLGQGDYEVEIND